MKQLTIDDITPETIQKLIRWTVNDIWRITSSLPTDRQHLLLSKIQEVLNEFQQE